MAPSAIPRPQRGKSFRRKPASVAIADVAVPRRTTKPPPFYSGKCQKSSASSAPSEGSEEPMDLSETRKRKGPHVSDDVYGKEAPT